MGFSYFLVVGTKYMTPTIKEGKICFRSQFEVGLVHSWLAPGESGMGERYCRGETAHGKAGRKQQAFPLSSIQATNSSMGDTNTQGQFYLFSKLITDTQNYFKCISEPVQHHTPMTQHTCVTHLCHTLMTQYHTPVSHTYDPE